MTPGGSIPGAWLGGGGARGRCWSAEGGQGPAAMGAVWGGSGLGWGTQRASLRGRLGGFGDDFKGFSVSLNSALSLGFSLLPLQPYWRRWPWANGQRRDQPPQGLSFHLGRWNQRVVAEHLHPVPQEPIHRACGDLCLGHAGPWNVHSSWSQRQWLLPSALRGCPCRAHKAMVILAATRNLPGACRPLGCAAMLGQVWMLWFPKLIDWINTSGFCLGSLVVRTHLFKCEPGSLSRDIARVGGFSLI